MSAEHWRDRAACRDADPELFQPEVASQADLDATVAAYCAVCPVRDLCRQLAESQPGAYGLHGGVWFGDPPASPAVRQCTWCHGDMDPERATAAYCSGRCRVAAHRARQAVSA